MPASYEKENEHFHNYNSSPSTCHSVSATTCALDACSPSDEDDLLTLLRHKNTNHINNEKKNHHLHDQQEKEEVEEERHAVATCQQDCIPYDYDEALYEDEDEEGDDKHNNNNNKSEEGDDEGDEKAPEPFSPAWLAQQHAMAATRKAAAQQAYTERKTKELNLFHSTYYYSNDNKDRHPINMFHIKALLREACYEDMQMLKHQSEEAFADAVLPFYHRIEQVPYRLSHPSALAASAAITCPAPAAAAAPAALTPRGSDHACNNDSQTKLSIIVNNNNNSNNINYYDCEEEEDDDSLLSPTTLRNKNMFEKEKQHLLLTYERLKVQQHINDNDGNNNNNKRHEILVLLKEVYIKAARLQWRKVQKDMEQYISFLSISLNNNNNNNNNSSSSSSNNSNNAPLIKQKSTLLLSAMSSMPLFQQDHILRFHTQNNNNNTDHANSSSVLIREAFCMKEVERQCSRRLQRSAQLLRDLKEQNVLFVPPPTPPPTPASPSLLHSEMCESRDTLYSNENENEKEMEEEDDDNVFGSDDGETTCDTILSANLTPEVSYSNVNITSGEGTEQQQCMTAAFQLPSSSFFDFCTSFTNSTNYYHHHQQQQQQLEQQEQHAFIPNEVDADGKEEEEDADSSALAAAAAAFNHARGRSTSGGTSAVLSASNSLASLDSEANGYVTTPNMHSSRAHHHHHHHHHHQNHHSLSHASPHTHINNNNNNNNHLYPYSYSRHINASAENSPVKTYNKPHRYEADSTKGAIGASYEIANKAIRLNKNHFSFPSPPFQAHAAGAPMEAHPPFSF